MATGYTARLEKRNYDVKRWIKEDAVRAMGVCVMLRDHQGELDEEGIREALKASDEESESGGYHTERLKQAGVFLVEAAKRTDDEWKAQYNIERAKAQDAYDARLIEFNIAKEAHIKASNQTAELLALAIKQKESDVVIGTLQFAHKQITETTDYDYPANGPYREAILDQRLSAYRDTQLESAQSNVKYHTEKAREEKTRTSDRYGAYVKLCDFINKTPIHD